MTLRFLGPLLLAPALALSGPALGATSLASAPSSGGPGSGTSSAGATLHWTPAEGPVGAVVALAYRSGLGPGTGAARLAVADAGAVWVGPDESRLVAVQRASGVRELAFADDGSLWIAGEEGLSRWRDGASERVVALRAGEGARRVHRIRGVAGLWLAAAEDGLHVRGPGAGWTRIDFPLPSGPATALAVAPLEEGLRVGVVVAGVAHWLRLGEAGARAEPTASGGPRASGAGQGGRSAADVWLAPDASEAWTLLRDGCLVGPARACAPLPPGAEARRLFRAAGRFWLATERGLLVGASALGPWRREPPPLGSLDTRALVAAEDRLLAGTERGLHVARLPGPAGAGTVADLPPRLLEERPEPPIAEVRRAVLAYLDLGAERLRAMRRGAARRGWLPEVAFRLERDSAVDRRRDFDEAFLSGGLRSLFDRVDDRHSGFEASLTLEWDLGDVLHHPESVDVSREVRELVELRDDVLDEVHHLYFERRRVLLELLALPAGRPVEAARLRLRADELAAGIDAWTGGWFGRHAVRLAP